MDLGAGLVGLLLGLLVGPLADRVATNAPVLPPAGDDPEAVPERRPLLAATPRSSLFVLVTLATGLLGAGCGLAFGLTATALISSVFCWILVVVTHVSPSSASTRIPYRPT